MQFIILAQRILHEPSPTWAVFSIAMFAVAGTVLVLALVVVLPEIIRELAALSGDWFPPRPQLVKTDDTTRRAQLEFASNVVPFRREVL